MDNLDSKLLQERARVIMLLSALANGLGRLSIEQLAEVLPLMAPIDQVANRVHRLGLPIF